MPVVDVEQFETHRRHLFGVAYRMLGMAADAEDAVQEAWLRLRRTDAGQIDDLRAWLTTVVGRICLDQLRSARVRREAYIGPWLPEPIITSAPTDGSPESAVELDESVRMAMLVVLEELSPEQRVAFVLHDIFAVPFNKVAETLGVSQPAARQLASRARRIVADAKPPARAPLPRQRQVADEFIRACATGDLETLTRLLHPDVIARGDGGGKVPYVGRHPVVGAAKVARLFLGLFNKFSAANIEFEFVGVNGDLGLRVTGDGFPTDVTTFAIGDDGLIVAVFNQLNPEKLRQ